MKRRHLDPKLFDRLLRGKASAEEMRELAWHLLDVCPDCSGAEEEWRVDDGATTTLDKTVEMIPSGCGHEEVSLERVRTRLEGSMAALFRQKDEAPASLEELLAHPPERQRLLIRNNPRFQSVPLAELWLDSVWEQGLNEPESGEQAAELVLELVDAIGPDLMGKEILDDLRGRAWAYRANFRRIRGDFRSAWEAFGLADRFVDQGSGDLLETARLCDLKSTLCRAQGRHEEAQDLIRKAIGIYRLTDESHLAGRTMVTQALLLKEQGKPGHAIRILKEAVGMIDAEREPYLMLIAHQNLVSYLTDLGRYEEAQAMLPRVRRRTVEIGRRNDLLRLRWLEGDIQLGLGHEARAESAFLEVRKGFAELGIGFDAATISLEIAALYLRQGRTAEIKQLAAEMVPIFESQDVHQETIAALLLFKKAVDMETLTARMLEEVSDVLQRSKGRPRPRSEQPS